MPRFTLSNAFLPQIQSASSCSNACPPKGSPQSPDALRSLSHGCRWRQLLGSLRVLGQGRGLALSKFVFRQIFLLNLLEKLWKWLVCGLLKCVLALGWQFYPSLPGFCLTMFCILFQFGANIRLVKILGERIKFITTQNCKRENVDLPYSAKRSICSTLACQEKHCRPLFFADSVALPVYIRPQLTPTGGFSCGIEIKMSPEGLDIHSWKQFSDTV